MRQWQVGHRLRSSESGSGAGNGEISGSGSSAAGGDDKNAQWYGEMLDKLAEVDSSPSPSPPESSAAACTPFEPGWFAGSGEDMCRL